MVYLTCAVIGLGGRGVIKTWTEMAARVRLYMLTSDLTSLVPPQFSHWLQLRKAGTAYLISNTKILLILEDELFVEFSTSSFMTDALCLPGTTQVPFAHSNIS